MLTEAYRLQGEFLLRYAVSDVVQAKSWELRAAMSLARSCQQQEQAAGSPRLARTDLWLVHRRL